MHPTLLFLSSSNTGFLGRGEGDGINVASRGISGSTKTIPKIKITRKSDCSLDYITTNALKRLKWLFLDATVVHLYYFTVLLSYQHCSSFEAVVSPCDFSIWYASQIFASGRDTVQLYSISITFVFTFSDTLSPRYLIVINVQLDLHQISNKAIISSLEGC